MKGRQGPTPAPGSASRGLHRRSAALLGALLLAHGGAGAAGTIGPVGPIGPVGTLGPNAAHRAHAPRPQPPGAVPGAARAAPSGPASPGNHIEVSGNTASGIRCADGASASVHSVDVAGARLQGRTVIVQGRNGGGALPGDCGGVPAQRTGPAGQTHSIRIR